MTSSRALFAVLLALLATTLVFTLWPGLDLWVSAAFYQPGAGFPLEQSVAFDLIRRTIWGASIGLVLLSVAGLLLAVFRIRIAGVATPVWAYILTLYALGPGFVVEWGLKGHWGRARPAQIVHFGGEASFTPFWQITDQCQRNCSFVGGESAGAMVLAIGLGLILRSHRTRLSRAWFRAGQAVLVGLPLLAAFQRVATGRHFLSDVVFSLLLMLLLALVLGKFLQPAPPAKAPQGGS